MSIWDPKPHVRVELEGLEEGGSYVITNWLDEAPVGQERDKCVIDPGETATFVMRHTFDKTIPAVTYIASMTSEKKDSWTIGASFANALNEK